MLKQRNYLAKFLHSTADAEAIAGMKDRMAAACQRFQVRRRPILHPHATIRHLWGQMEGNIAIEALAAEILSFTKVRVLIHVVLRTASLTPLR